MEVFKIWSTLNIQGNALSEMEKFSLLVSKAGKEMGLLTEKLGFLSKTFSFLKTDTIASDIAMKSLGENFSMLSIKTSNLVNETEKLGRSLKTIAVDGKAAKASMSSFETSGGRSGGHGGIRAVGHIMREAEMGRGAGMFTSLATGAMAGGPALAMAAGIAIPTGMLLHAGFHQEGEMQKNLAQLQEQGFNQNQLIEARKLATNPNVKGVAPMEMMEALKAGQIATQDWSEAKFLAPKLAKAISAAQVSYGGMTEAQLQDAVRVAEFKGGSDKNKVSETLDTVFGMMSLSAGTLKPTELKTFFKRSLSASTNLTKEGVFALEPTIQEAGGSTAGSGLRVLNQLLVGGAGMTANKAKMLERVGIIHKGDVKYDKEGRPVGNKYGMMDPEMQNLLQHDPAMWLEKTIPGLKKAGINTDEEVADFFKSTFLGNPGNLLATMYKNMGKVKRARTKYSDQADVEKAYQISQQTQAGAIKNLDASWEHFATVFGGETAPAMTKAIRLLSDIIDSATPAIKNFITGAKPLVKAISGVFSPILEALSPIAKQIGPLLKLTVSGLTPIVNMIGWVVKTLIESLKTLYNGLFKTYMNSTANRIKGSIDTINSFPAEMKRIWSPESSDGNLRGRAINNFPAEMKKIWSPESSDGNLRGRAIPSINKNSYQAKQGDVYLDKKKVGMIMNNNLFETLHSGGTSSSSNHFNSSLTLAPVGVSHYGGQQ